MKNPRAIIVCLLLLGALAPPARRASAAWEPPGIDLTRPRLLFRAGDEPVLQARLEREPYVSILKDMRGRTNIANGIALDDHGVESERFKARAAKNQAFLYAVDRTLVGGNVVPFPSPADRAAVGTYVQGLLVNMYTRHRVAVPPPLGGWDRDISSSEELVQYATAYDTMLGAGWDFGGDKATIERNIVDLASEMYENFLNPDTASGFTRLHQNNHRSKSGAAMVMAAIAVAEFTPEPGSDPRGVREPTKWLEYGLDQVDLVMRYVLVTGDGAYAEGPFYLRFAAQNLIPFGRAWDRLVNGASWNARGIEVPSLWRHPLWLRTQRWMLDMTLPDGSMAAIDDGNPGRSHYFGILPPALPWSGAFAWRWANAPQPIDTDGNIDLGPDAIALFDDTVPAGPPTGPTTAFYYSGGNAIFRSDWSTDGIVANVQAEHDTASEFGHDRAGLGVQPQSHEHAEPGAFLLHAFGERLAIDPGYLSFTEHAIVNHPEHHNVILVDGKGPVDYLVASLQWQANLAGPPPADGQAYLSDAIDGSFLDAATVRTTYGLPPQREAQIARRFLFADDRYLVLLDDVTSPGGPPRSYSWLLHGNGGGTSGGTFESTAHGGRWTQPLARLDSAIALDTAVPAFSVSTGQHEAPGKILTTHSILKASASGDHLRSVQFLYPTRSSDPAPVVDAPTVAGAAALVLADSAGDRRVLALHRAGTSALIVPGSATGLAEAATDGVRAVFDAHTDTSLRLAWAEGATFLRYGGVEYLRVAKPGALGVALRDGRADVVADTGDATIDVHGLPFHPLAADGACSLADDGTVVTLALSRERRVTLRAAAGNSAPAADPGADRYVALGTRVVLDAAASCDRDGDALTPSWELVETPIGADWNVADAGTAQPSFLANKRGEYRWRLTVTDAHGASSLPKDVVIRAVDPSEDPDGDLVPADVDNCGKVANADQADDQPSASGGNSVGDACECSDGSCIPGGGSAASDCAFEVRSLGGATFDGRRLRCRDGESCDSDPAPGVCGFDVVLCFANEDAARPACASFAPREVRIRNWVRGKTPDLVSLLAALPGGQASGARRVAFDPPLAGKNVCTDPVRLSVPRPGASLNVSILGAARRAIDSDRIRFVCDR